MAATTSESLGARQLRRWFAILVASGLGIGVVACDRTETSDGERSAEARPAESPDEGESRRGGQDEHAEEDDHDHGHGGVHLGAKMNELGRRFAAVWFAGKAGNEPMVSYQIHEMEEVAAEIEASGATEKGIDVAKRLQSDVVGRLEKLEASVAADKKDFKGVYQSIMNKCSDCHAMTGHDFIDVQIPTATPYPNLDMQPKDEIGDETGEGSQ